MGYFGSVYYTTSTQTNQFVLSQYLKIDLGLNVLMQPRDRLFSAFSVDVDMGLNVLKQPKYRLFPVF